MNSKSVVKYDASIVISYLIFVVFFFCDEYYDIVSIVEAFLISILFSLGLRKTNEQDKLKRLKSLFFACNFMIAFPCALKITELLTGLILPVDTLGIVLSSIALQSIHFILMSRKR